MIDPRSCQRLAGIGGYVTQKVSPPGAPAEQEIQETAAGKTTLCTYLLFPHVTEEADADSLQNTRLKYVLLSEALRDRHDLRKGGQICLAISASVYPSSTSKAPPARKMSMR